MVQILPLDIPQEIFERYFSRRAMTGRFREERHVLSALVRQLDPEGRRRAEFCVAFQIAREGMIEGAPVTFSTGLKPLSASCDATKATAPCVCRRISHQAGSVYALLSIC